MNIATYSRRNLFRRRGRAILTIIVVALAVFIFCAIRAFVAAFNAGADQAQADRLATRHKVSITMNLPKHYIEQLREVPGVKSATWANWFGAKDPRERVPFFAGFAVDQDSYFEVQDDIKITPEELTTWKQTANGAILGDRLAQAFGVKVGDRLVINSDIYPGDWDFKVVGIYAAVRKTADRSSLIFRWDYLNNSGARAAFSQERIGWMISRITDPAGGAEIAKRIDAKFDGNDDQTLTMSERAFALAFLGGYTAFLGAVDWMSLGILLIMALILANTIAMSVRERTHEYGVLRAIGFPPGHVVGFIVGESLLIAVVGGVLGIGAVTMLINHGLGPLLADSNPNFFQNFFASTRVLAIALGAAAVLGAVAGAFPAMFATRRSITDALRRVD